MTIEELQDKINQGRLYYLILLEQYRQSLITGCEKMPTNMRCLRYIIQALQPDADGGYITDNTLAVYKQLLNILGGYSAIYTLDPSVIIPGTTIIVQGDGGMPPIPITSADFDGRDYNNPELAGMTDYMIFFQGINRFLNSDEFTYLPTGGFTLSQDVYDGMEFRLIF